VKRASKLVVLEFIRDKEIIRAFDLIERFGYSEGGAWATLSWLKREGLIINDRKGEWTITDLGLKRLIYYGR